MAEVGEDEQGKDEQEVGVVVYCLVGDEEAECWQEEQSRVDLRGVLLHRKL